MFDEKTINTEVRVRMLERIADSIDKRFEHLENKIDTQFKRTVGIMISMFGVMVSMLGGLIIAKLV
jgi:hypothetical protein